MAEEIRFSDLANVGNLDPSAIVAIVQEQQGELVSLQCSVAQIAYLIVNGIEFQGLTSNDKKLIGAINEALAGGGGGDVTKAYVDAQDSALQSQIDNELAEIRELNNALYSTEELEFTDDLYINLSGTKADINNPVTSSSGFGYAFSYCKVGDVFTISGIGGSASRLYGFVSFDGTILEVAPSGYGAEDLTLIAPENTSLFIVNSKTPRKAIKTIALNDQVNSIVNTYITPEAFGVPLGDISNFDCSKIFQSLIDFSAKNDIPVLIPTRTYHVTQTLTLRKGMNLIGFGCSDSVTGSILASSANPVFKGERLESSPLFADRFTSKINMSGIGIRGIGTNDTFASERYNWSNWSNCRFMKFNRVFATALLTGISMNHMDFTECANIFNGGQVSDSSLSDWHFVDGRNDTVSRKSYLFNFSKVETSTFDNIYITASTEKNTGARNIMLIDGNSSVKLSNVVFDYAPVTALSHQSGDLKMVVDGCTFRGVGYEGGYIIDIAGENTQVVVKNCFFLKSHIGEEFNPIDTTYSTRATVGAKVILEDNFYDELNPCRYRTATDGTIIDRETFVNSTIS